MPPFKNARMPCRACGKLVTYHTFTKQVMCATSLDPLAVQQAKARLALATDPTARPDAEREYRTAIAGIITGP